MPSLHKHGMGRLSIVHDNMGGGGGEGLIFCHYYSYQSAVAWGSHMHCSMSVHDSRGQPLCTLITFTVAVTCTYRV